MLKIVFWILFIIIAYSYLGYAIILLILNLFKRLFRQESKPAAPADYPEVSLLIAAYNEKDIVNAKMENSLLLDYPAGKLSVVWITDGSDDGTPELLGRYPGVKVLHDAERKGKTAALNRALEHIHTPFVVFCDANTMLEKSAITKLIAPFSDKRTGCVAGEKRIVRGASDAAAGVGEGTYWQYESWLKKLESDFYSSLSAAGELYAIRTDLFEAAEPDSIIDDFVISIKIARNGYRIRYEPEAYAIEKPSASIRNELKRKIRIATGGFQTIFRYPSLLNFFRYGFLSFEYFSHKVLRWLFVPLAIPLIFIVTVLLCFTQGWQPRVYMIMLAIQVLFYLMVIFGVLVEKNAIRMKYLFLPYYLVVMNYAQLHGLVRYLRKKHTVVWEKAERA